MKASSQTIQAVGLVHATLCALLDQDKDPRTLEVPALLEDVLEALEAAPPFHDQASFARHVWEVGSKVDVSGHIGWMPRRKNRGTKENPDWITIEIPFLPWAKALVLLKDLWPESKYAYSENLFLPNGSVEVGILLGVREGPYFMEQEVRLPVMDDKFNSIKDPGSRDLNDARQRCLVKAIATTTGIGLNLWTDEQTTPVGELKEPISGKQAQGLHDLLEKLPAERREWFMDWAKIEAVEELPNFKYKEARGLLETAVKSLGDK